MSFLPVAKAHSDLSKPIVLMYDGHGSHVTLEMIDKAMEKHVSIMGKDVRDVLMMCMEQQTRAERFIAVINRVRNVSDVGHRVNRRRAIPRFEQLQDEAAERTLFAAN